MYMPVFMMLVFCKSMQSVPPISKWMDKENSECREPKCAHSAINFGQECH